MKAPSLISPSVEQPAAAKKKGHPDIPVAFPPDFDEEDIWALKALASGTATQGQQRTALKWILYKGCLMGVDAFMLARNDRGANYVLGRQAVGRSISTLIDAHIVTPKQATKPE